MSAEDCQKRATLYAAILTELVEKCPMVKGKWDVGLDDSSVVDVTVRVTMGYEHWLGLRGGNDVSDVQFNNQGTVFAPGKHAVQFLLSRSVSIVKQLLEKGVDPDVAVRLLPYELATAVHREYWERTT